MANNDITRGNKLSMATQGVSLLVLLGTIIMAWGKLDGRIAMAEHRIVQLEAQGMATTARRDTDNTALGNLASKIDVQSEKLQSLTDQFKEFRASLNEPPRRR